MIKILLIVGAVVILGLAVFGAYVAYVLYTETKEGGPW